MLRLGLLLSVMISGVCLADGSAGTAGPYPQYPEFYRRAKALTAGQGDFKALIKDIDAEFDKVVLPVAKPKERLDRDRRLNQLICLNDAAYMAQEKGCGDVVQLLLDDPLYLDRFLHALDQYDNQRGALKVLKVLKDYDEKRFRKWREFCIAFAVVWDDFHGYSWVDKKCGPVSDDFMLELYKYFVTNESRMWVKPWDLPYELSAYVVHSRVPPEERQWVLQNYARYTNPYAIYSGVPWTQKLSPAHGLGGDIPYTMMNIKMLGGVCMEQAYFTEQVLRLHGVPAVYMGGEGARGGHAWVGVFMPTPKAHWDFSTGRYRYDHYYLGESFDPTSCDRRAPMLLEPEIKMTAIFASGLVTLANIQKSYCYCRAVRWVEHDLPETIDGPAKTTRSEVIMDLLNEALQANPYNERVWDWAAQAAVEKRMTPAQAMTWAKKLVNLTLDSFPEFTVGSVGRFLDCSDKPDAKLEVYERLFTTLSKPRPDLACVIKVAEGDIWKEKGDMKQALQCFVHPMVAFSKDDHILAKAKKKLEALGLDGQRDEVIKACQETLKILVQGQQTPERKEAADIILKKLNSLQQNKEPSAGASIKTDAAGGS